MLGRRDVRIGSILRNCSTNSGRIILAPITKHLLRLFGGTASSLPLTIFVADNSRDDAPAEIDAIAGAHRGAENVEAYKRMATDERARDD
jgi:hypothetical protein